LIKAVTGLTRRRNCKKQDATGGIELPNTNASSVICQLIDFCKKFEIEFAICTDVIFTETAVN